MSSRAGSSAICSISSESEDGFGDRGEGVLGNSSGDAFVTPVVVFLIVPAFPVDPVLALLSRAETEEADVVPVRDNGVVDAPLVIASDVVDAQVSPEDDCDRAGCRSPCRDRVRQLPAKRAKIPVGPPLPSVSSLPFLPGPGSACDWHEPETPFAGAWALDLAVALASVRASRSARTMSRRPARPSPVVAASRSSE